MSSYGDNVPRRLTAGEIERVASAIDVAYGGTKEVRQKMIEQLKEHVRKQVENITITPLGIDDLISKTRQMYHRALIQPGTPVGSLAAGTLGREASQTVLDSFHRSGVGEGTGGGLMRLEQWIRAAKVPSHVTSQIFFAESLSFGEVLDEGNKISFTSVGSIVKRSILSQSSTDQDWWIAPFEKTNLRDECYTGNEGDHFLRLYLDTSKLYNMRITLESISNEIKTTKLKKSEKNVIGKNDCISIRYSPDYIGIMDIIPNPSKISVKSVKKSLSMGDGDSDSIDPVTLIKVFLTNLMLPLLDSIQIRGIEGIEEVFPRSNSVLSAVRSDGKRDDGSWRVNLDEVASTTKGISSMHVANLFHASGYNVEAVERFSIVVRQTLVVQTNILEWMKESQAAYEREYAIHQPNVELLQKSLGDNEALYDELRGAKNVKEIDKLLAGFENADPIKKLLGDVATGTETLNQLGDEMSRSEAILKRFDTFDISPYPYVKDLVKRRKEMNDSNISLARREGRVFDRDSDAVVKMSSTHSAVAKGSNLEKLFSLKNIEPRFCTSSNVREVIDSLGILAAKKYYARSFIEMTANSGSSTEPRHVMLPVSYMMRYGRITPLTFSGFSVHHGRDTFEKMAFQSTLKSAALGVGLASSTTGSATRKMFDVDAPVGTGKVLTKKGSEENDELIKQCIKSTQSKTARAKVSGSAISRALRSSAAKKDAQGKGAVPGIRVASPQVQAPVQALFGPPVPASGIQGIPVISPQLQQVASDMKLSAGQAPAGRKAIRVVRASDISTTPVPVDNPPAAQEEKKPPTDQELKAIDDLARSYGIPIQHIPSVALVIQPINFEALKAMRR